MAGGDVMLDRTVYKRAILEGRGVDYPWNGGLARVTARVLLRLAGACASSGRSGSGPPVPCGR